MIIVVGCPTCAHRYDVAGRLAGKKVRCKECSNVFRVPVPTTMPAPQEKRPRKRKVEDESLAELLVSAASSGPALVVNSGLGGNSFDLGERRSYRAFQFVVIGLFVAGWTLGWGSPLRMAIGLCVVVGLFLLLPILCGWESFEQTRRVKILSRVLGLEAVKGIQATAAIALWVFAVLIGMDTIHISALEPLAAAPAEAIARPEPEKPADDK